MARVRSLVNHKKEKGAHGLFLGERSQVIGHLMAPPLLNPPLVQRMEIRIWICVQTRVLDMRAHGAT